MKDKYLGLDSLDYMIETTNDYDFFIRIYKEKLERMIKEEKDIAPIIYEKAIAMLGGCYPCMGCGSKTITFLNPKCKYCGKDHPYSCNNAPRSHDLPPSDTNIHPETSVS